MARSLTYTGSISPVPNVSCSGTLLVSRAFAYLGLLATVLDLTHSSFGLSLHSFCRLGAVVSLLGAARSGPLFSLPVTEFSYASSPVFSQSCARLNALLPILDSAHLGVSLPLKDFSQLDVSLPTFGLARCGFLFLLLVLEIACLESLVSSQSLSHLEPTPPVLDLSNLNAFASPKVLS